MGQSPFAKRSAPVDTPSDRRQSTRVDVAVPIVISGRDASGQPFREATETISVSFHGASLKTRKQILIGMQLTVENLAGGLVGKSICVRVAEAAPGRDLHAIAIQLLVPSNLWGVKNPPADWKSAADVIRQAAPAAKSQPPAAVAAASSELEQRSADLAESVLHLLRGQAAGILRESLKEFEERLKFLESGAEARIIHQAEKAINNTDSRVSSNAERSVADAEVSLAKLRRDLLEQLTARTDRAIVSAEAALRDKIAALLAEHLKAAGISPQKQSEQGAKK